MNISEMFLKLYNILLHKVKFLKKFLNFFVKNSLKLTKRRKAIKKNIFHFIAFSVKKNIKQSDLSFKKHMIYCNISYIYTIYIYIYHI